MRVLFGEYKGRVLKTPRDFAIRPTTGRMRDWICNVLMNEFRGLRICDLFAGSGTLGIHALSLGAKNCLFVDKSPVAIRLVKENLRILGIEEKNTIVRKDVLSFLQGASGLNFDLVFVDPPYDSTDYDELLRAIDKSSFLGDGALLIVEHPTNTVLPDIGLEVWREKRFGRSTIHIYRNE